MIRWRLKKFEYQDGISYSSIPEFYFDVLLAFKFIKGSIYTKEQVLLEREYGNRYGRDEHA